MNAIIDDQAQTVRMANLAVVGSHSVNGVAGLHSEILKSRVFPELYHLFPKKFNNKTNGITPPAVAAAVESGAVGADHRGHRQRLAARPRSPACAGVVRGGRLLSPAVAEREARPKGSAGQVAAAVPGGCGTGVAIRRADQAQHEYKRQLLNVMHVIAIYQRLLAGVDSVPRAVIFGGKPAPSYFIAKLIIKLIHDVGAMVRANPMVSQRLSVAFVPNYSVSAAEVLFPATELSEQISTAGTEASGTGCMKAVLNGGVIIGTLDGANIEIREQVGEANLFVFGHTADEIQALSKGGYDPGSILRANPELASVVQRIGAMSGGIFKPLVAPGACSTLAWTTANAATVSIDNGLGGRPVNGSTIVCPAVTTSYVLTATGEGGSATRSMTVTVTYGCGRRRSVRH